MTVIVFEYAADGTFERTKVMKYLEEAHIFVGEYVTVRSPFFALMAL